MDIIVQCAHCGKDFYKSKKRVNENKKVGSKNFCSKECFVEARTTAVKTVCTQCGKDIEVKLSQKSKSKSGNSFCSMHCAAIFNNKHYPKRLKNVVYSGDVEHRIKIQLEPTYCLNCGEPTDNRRKYCNSKCWVEYEHGQRVIKWKAGLLLGHADNKDRNVKSFVKKYMFIKHGGKCEICGWDKIHPKTKKVPLTIHHIDGDNSNTVEENLQLLCGNCHTLTDTYCGLNTKKRREKNGE